MGWERWGWLDEWGYDVERETEIWVSKGEHECLRDALAFACPNRPIAAEDLWGEKLRYAFHTGLMERSGRSCPSSTLSRETARLPWRTKRGRISEEMELGRQSGGAPATLSRNHRYFPVFRISDDTMNDGEPRDGVTRRERKERKERRHEELWRVLPIKPPD